LASLNGFVIRLGAGASSVSLREIGKIETCDRMTQAEKAVLSPFQG